MNLLSGDAIDVERWRRIESVLDPALDLRPHEVAAYLDRVCAGHPELRAEIEALLEAERRAEGFLSVPAIVLANPFASDAGAGLSVEAGDPLAPRPAPAPTPERLGPYRLLGELGRGGMGIVYRGRDESLGREVAIKALPPAVAEDPERLARFLHEARLLGMLHDPHIAQILGIESAGGRRYLILECVEGTTLSDRLRAGALPLTEAIDCCAQVAWALAAAHAHGIVHRDLKPGNIMCTPQGLVKVLDFGLAIHETHGEDIADLVATRAHGNGGRARPRVGTPGYMSPEQILGRPQDARTDLFALGAVLYHCLTGARAFPGTSVYSVVDATLHAVPDMTRLSAETPETVRALLASMLEKDTALRPRDVSTAAAVLDAAGAPRGLRAPRPDHAIARCPRDTIVRLPEVATPLVGRRHEIAETLALLERAPLVTLTGAGGCGKTRLGLEVARAASDAGMDEIWFADLAPAADATAVATAVAAAADVRDPAESKLEATLAARLAGRRGLLVLDNCDRVAGASAALASRLLAGVRGLHVLATSRERLGVSGEQALRVAPLAVPEADAPATREAAGAADSVRMFVACASAVRPGFALADGNARTVAGICRDLDGVPLAIELAAALLRAQSLEEIAEDLRARTRAAAPDALQAAIELSYDRLAAEERRLFRALSVFVGGWSLDSAVAICATDPDPFATLDVLTRLIDKSLVAIQRVDRAEPRYRFLEPIRHFAVARCETAREDLGLRARHLEWFLATAERAVPSLLSGSDQARCLASLEADHANVLSALAACESVDGGATTALRLAGSVWLFWYIRGHFARGRQALERALALPGAQAATPARAQALFAAGGLAVFQGDFAEGRRLSRQALELYETLGDSLGVARSVSHLALCDSGEGRIAEAREQTQRAIAIFRAAGDERRLSATLNNLGALERQQGGYGAALPHHEEALELLRRAGDRDGTIVTLVNLGLVSIRLGRERDAGRHIDEALALVQSLRARRAAANALEVAAEVLVARGLAEDGARLLGAVRSLRVAISLSSDESWRRARDEVTERLRAALGASRFDELVSSGHEIGFEAAVELARTRLAAGHETPAPSMAADAASLTGGNEPQPTKGMR